jgi:hypothetical protein
MFALFYEMVVTHAQHWSIHLRRYPDEVRKNRRIIRSWIVIGAIKGQCAEQHCRQCEADAESHCLFYCL